MKDLWKQKIAEVVKSNIDSLIQTADTNSAKALKLNIYINGKKYTT